MTDPAALEYSVRSGFSQGAKSWRFHAAELYALVLSALNYLQDDGGQFRKGAEKAGLTREEFWLLNRFRYFPGTVAPGDFLTFGPYASLSTYEQQSGSAGCQEICRSR